MSSEADFVDAVAARAMSERATVRDILERHHVPVVDMVRASTRRLLVTGVRFTGTRPPDHEPQRIDFEWSLGAGLHAIATRGPNLRGKSSVLNIVLWALRGRIGHLRDDVRHWLDHVEVDVTIANEAYRVAFDVAEGVPSGTISGLEPTHTIAGFTGAEAMERQVSAFMLDRLALQSWAGWQKYKGSDEGRATTLDWPSFSQVLTVPDSDVVNLLGDTHFNGLPGRLLQIFVGLPWARTHAAARVAAEQCLRPVDEPGEVVPSRSS